MRVLRRLYERNRQAKPGYEKERARREETRRRRRRFREAYRRAVQALKLREGLFGELLTAVAPDRRQALFRALARVLHPDRGRDTELMKQLNVAYESFPEPSPRDVAVEDFDDEQVLDMLLALPQAADG